MLFKPAQLGLARLDPAELAADRKACKKIGPCGVGKKALYLNSFYIDRSATSRTSGTWMPCWSCWQSNSPRSGC